MTYVVGLTGGIGSGKTTVAERLEALGASVIDTDRIARSLTGPGGAAMAAVRDAFGAEYVDPSGALDRAAMRARAFGDQAARARLESILHPMIRAHSDREIARAHGPYALLVVPLLFETGGYAGRVQRVAVVDCDEHLQLRRTMARSRLDAQTVRRIMGAQWPRWRRLQMADDVVWNGGDAAALEPQCGALHARWCERARSAAKNL